MKKRGHLCHVCGRRRANEKFSGKGHAKHICKDCDREHRAQVRARKKAKVIFVQAFERPARKLVLKRAATAEGYFAYCEEVGCEVWDELKAIPGALGEPLGLWLPSALRPAGTSLYVQGVEVADDYDGLAPAGFEMVALPPRRLMIFQGPPFEDEKIGEAIDAVQAAIRKFVPQRHGHEWADDAAPRVQWEPMGKRGYMEARPVRRCGTPDSFFEPWTRDSQVEGQ